MLEPTSSSLVCPSRSQVCSHSAHAALNSSFEPRSVATPETQNLLIWLQAKSSRCSLQVCQDALGYDALLTQLIATFLATALLFIRTVFRAVELSEGFSGKLANNEVQFMVLDGVMVILASFCLTVFHPGWGFQGRWQEANFNFGKKKPVVDTENSSTDPENAREKRPTHYWEAPAAQS